MVYRRFDLLCVITLAVMAAFFFLHAEGTSDLFWHLKTGEIIWQTGEIPRADIFSYTKAGSAWINHEWLAEIIFYAAWRIGGFVGLSLLSFLIGISIVFVLYALFSRMSRTHFKTPSKRNAGFLSETRKMSEKPGGVAQATLTGFSRNLTQSQPKSQRCSRGGFEMGSNSMPLGIVLTLVTLSLGASRFQQLRPELFGFLFFGCVLLVITKMKTWLLVPILILWANIHGSVVVGIAVIAIYALVQKKKVLLFYSLLPLINPFTYRIYSFPFGHILESYSLSVTSDWAGLKWFSPQADIAAWGLAALSLGCVVLAICRRRDINVPIFLIAIVCAALGFWMIRFVPFAGISVCLFLATLVSHKWLDIRPVFITAFVVCIIISGVGPIYGARFDNGRLNFVFGRPVGLGFEVKEFPVGAANFIRDNKIAGNIFNDMAWGGYLIWRNWPQRLVFIDTRTPVYGDDFIRGYTDALFRKEAFDLMADKYSISHVLYDVRQMEEPNGPLKFLFNNPNWVPVFRSANAVVFVKIL